MARHPIATSDQLYAAAQAIELATIEGSPLAPAVSGDIVDLLRRVALDLVRPVTVVVPGRLSTDTWIVATVSPGGRWRGVSAWSSEHEARRNARNVRRRHRVRK